MNTQSFKEIMRRSLANYEFIRPDDAKDGPYAVTQLVNSFSGAFAHAYDKTLDKEFLDKSKTAKSPAFRAIPTGWPSFDLDSDTDACFTQLTDIRDLCRHVRNAMAHGNIEFEEDPNTREITRVHVWSLTDSGKKWGGSLSVTDLKTLLNVFYKFINSTFDDNGSAFVASRSR